MGLVIGDGYNTNDESEGVNITLNSSTSTTIKAADIEDTFIIFKVINESNFDVYIKLQPASVDDLKEGEPLPRGSIWSMDKHDLYKGEVSAIARTGSPVVRTIKY